MSIVHGAQVIQGSLLPNWRLRFRSEPRLTHSGASAVQCTVRGPATRLPSTLPALWPHTAGERLPPAVQRTMEELFHADLSMVRVHVGNEPTTLGALAFTRGSNLFFNHGRFDPSSPAGLRLLGHELTHVLQQCAGRVRNPFGAGVALVQDPMLEAEAERMALQAGRLHAVWRAPSGAMQPFIVGGSMPRPAWAVQPEAHSTKGEYRSSIVGASVLAPPTAFGSGTPAHQLRPVHREVAQPMITRSQDRGNTLNQTTATVGKHTAPTCYKSFRSYLNDHPYGSLADPFIYGGVDDTAKDYVYVTIYDKKTFLWWTNALVQVDQFVYFGNRQDDIDHCNTNYRRESGYTWHHTGWPFDQTYGTMQLVPTKEHSSIPHYGGVYISKKKT